MKILAEISAGELADKVTILEIKGEQLEFPEALRNVNTERLALEARLDPIIKNTPALTGLKAELKQINQTLWKIEDDIREKERQKDFGDAFVQLARSVYFENDRRARVKRQINDLVGSAIVEEKSYSEY